MTGLSLAEWEKLFDSKLKTFGGAIKADYDTAIVTALEPVIRKVNEGITLRRKERSDEANYKETVNARLQKMELDIAATANKQHALIQSHRLLQGEVMNMNDRMRRNNLRFTHMEVESPSFDHCISSIQQLLLQSHNLNVVRTEFQRAHITGYYNELNDVTLIACFFRSELKESIINMGKAFREYCEKADVYTVITNDYCPDTLACRQQLVKFAKESGKVGFKLKYDKLEYEGLVYEVLHGNIVSYPNGQRKSLFQEQTEVDDNAIEEGATGGQEGEEKEKAPKQQPTMSSVKAALNEALNNSSSVITKFYPPTANTHQIPSNKNSPNANSNNNRGKGGLRKNEDYRNVNQYRGNGGYNNNNDFRYNNNNNKNSYQPNGSFSGFPMQFPPNQIFYPQPNQFWNQTPQHGYYQPNNYNNFPNQNNRGRGRGRGRGKPRYNNNGSGGGRRGAPYQNNDNSNSQSSQRNAGGPSQAMENNSLNNGPRVNAEPLHDLEGINQTNQATNNLTDENTTPKQRIPSYLVGFKERSLKTAKLLENTLSNLKDLQLNAKINDASLINSNTNKTADNTKCKVGSCK